MTCVVTCRAQPFPANRPSAPAAPVLALEANGNEVLAVLESGEVVSWSTQAQLEAPAPCYAPPQQSHALAVSLFVAPAAGPLSGTAAVGLEEEGLVLLRRDATAKRWTIQGRYSVDYGSVTAGAFLPCSTTNGDSHGEPSLKRKGDGWRTVDVLFGFFFLLSSVPFPHTASCASCASPAPPQVLAYGGSAGVLYLATVSSEATQTQSRLRCQPQRCLHVHSDALRCITVDTTSGALLVASDDSTLSVWDSQSVAAAVGADKGQPWASSLQPICAVESRTFSARGRREIFPLALLLFFQQGAFSPLFFSLQRLKLSRRSWRQTRWWLWPAPRLRATASPRCALAERGRSPGRR